MPSVVSDSLAEQVTVLQRRIVDEGRQVLVVFEGRSGRVMGRVINEFMNLLEPRGLLYSHFVPESDTCPRDLLRYISREPAKGVVEVYDRSWYSRIVARANSGLDTSEDLETAVSLERYFVENGVTVVKIYLNMSDERIADLGESYGGGRPDANFLIDDHIDPKNWREKLVMPIIAKTSSVHAPWDIIDVDDPESTMAKVLHTFLTRAGSPLCPGSCEPLSIETPYPNPRETADLDQCAKGYQEKLSNLSREVARLQNVLAESDRSLILVFEGWDAAGKGGSIKRLVRAMSPRGYYIRPVAAPVSDERLHTYLWRFTYNLPKAGHITIYDRSWYGRMMVEPIEGFCTPEEYSRSAAEINNFERQICDSGGIVVKFWMEISSEEQLRRFQARQDNPVKQWKITDEDWRNREKWDVYSEYVDRMISSTNTPYAPWVVVESEDKKYGRLKVLQTVVDVLKEALERVGSSIDDIRLRHRYIRTCRIPRSTMDEFKQKIAGEIAISPDPGKTIRKWREEFGLSQYQLAEAMGVSHSVVSDYESGRRRSPGVNVVRKMVDAFIELDIRNGSPVISRYNPQYKLDCIISMDEFAGGVSVDAFIEAVEGRNLNTDRLMAKSIFGYTMVDSIKAILSLGSEDYLKIYGSNTERALVFTNVHYGRSPMVAVRAHPLTPAMVVYIQPGMTDPLAVKLAGLEGIPLVVTDLSVDEFIERMERLEGMQWKSES